MMKISSALKGAALCLSCLGLLLPQLPAMAAEPQPRSAAVSPSFRVLDVALGPQGTLQGAVVDQEGIAVPATGVVLLQGDRAVAVTETDGQGRFAFLGLTGGVYGIGAAGVVRVCRLWAPHTAPPAAGQGVLVVADGQTVRGRGPMRDTQSRVYNWVSEHYLLTYAFIGAAIVVPVVIIASNQDEGPAS